MSDKLEQICKCGHYKDEHDDLPDQTFCFHKDCDCDAFSHQILDTLEPEKKEVCMKTSCGVCPSLGQKIVL